MKTQIIAVGIIIVIIIGFGLWSSNRWLVSDNEPIADLPRGGDASIAKILIEDGEVLDQSAGDLSAGIETITNEDGDEILREVREIMITKGYKHSVPLDSIRGGGPPQDGIPSIDIPKFISIGEADLNDTEPGIAFSLNGIDRFYPFQILVWHEIVNDTFDGQRALITYCPLCLSGIVFDPIVQGERVEFGTSGKLWNSNLVMYDRKTQTLWSQILGEAIAGEKTGSALAVLPSDQIRYGKWKILHPDGQVLSKDTGAKRFYGNDPYGNYYTTEGTIFPVDIKDDRLSDKAYVLGIVIDGKAKAYLPETIKAQGTVEDSFASKTIIAQYDADIDAVRLFERKLDGTEDRINPFPNFWFSWVAAHPDTELYK